MTALQPLPLVEFQGEWSLGYNGSDLFSPEMDYCVDPTEIAPYLQRANALLAKKGQPPLTARHLSSQINQLKALIDICHVYGIAVIPDVVYNHAGGGFDPQSIDHFDFLPNPATPTACTFPGSRQRRWPGVRVQPARGARLPHP